MHTELKTVTAKIGGLIMDFYKQRMDTGAVEFHAQDLVDHVCSAILVAPNSPTRILQDMRKRGIINYELLSRRQSFYKFTPLVQE